MCQAWYEFFEHWQKKHGSRARRVTASCELKREGNRKSYEGGVEGGNGAKKFSTSMAFNETLAFSLALNSPLLDRHRSSEAPQRKHG